MKLDLSFSVKRWLRDSIAIIAFMELFYILTKCGIFIFCIFGYLAGSFYVAISQYIRDYLKQKAIYDLEAVIENRDGSVIENYKEIEVSKNEWVKNSLHF